MPKSTYNIAALSSACWEILLAKPWLILSCVNWNCPCKLGGFLCRTTVAFFSVVQLCNTHFGEPGLTYVLFLYVASS